MSFAWIVNRMRVMSLAELVFRGWRWLYQILERRWIKSGWAPGLHVGVRPGLQLFSQLDECAECWRSDYELNEPALHDIAIGRLAFFGHAPMDFGQPINWHRDPSSDTVAPRTYGKAIDYRNETKVGNIKLIWELGRHQHLIPLTVAYVCTGDTRYRDVVTRQIDGWIQDNPYGLGVHWCSSLEVALRLTAWAIVHSLLTLRDGGTGLFQAVTNKVEFRRSVFQQAWFVAHYFSRYSSANNHLIGELTGLFVATTVFDMGRQGKSWKGFALRELENEMMHQVHADGVNKEQSTYYHLWVLEYMLLTWMVAARAGKPMSRNFGERLRKMGGFLSAITPAAGVPPQIGDSDDGSAVRFEAEWPIAQYDAVLAALELAFPGDTYRSCTGTVPQKAFWFGQIAARGRQSVIVDGAEKGRQMPREFPQGGYAVLGTPARMVLFDAGPLGYPSIAAHGHADALAICMAIDSRWWLVDPGTYSYHGEPHWRNYFRGTAAHNTVVVDNKDQSLSGGAFLWINHARAVLSSVETDSNGWQSAHGRHDGYKKFGIEHYREVRVSPTGDQIDIIDELEGLRRHNFRLHFHFAPDIRVVPAASHGEWIAERGNEAFRLRICVDTHWKWAVSRGSESPRLGWYSTMLGAIEPAVCLHGAIDADAPCKHRTRIFVESK